MADIRFAPRSQLGTEGALYLIAGVILVGGLTAAGIIATSETRRGHLLLPRLDSPRRLPVQRRRP